MRGFLNNREGNFALVFAVGAIPVVGMAGLAIDYTRATNVKSFIQAQADATALSAAQLGPSGDDSAYRSLLRSVVVERYGEGDWIEELAIETGWHSNVDYWVEVRGQVPNTLLTVVPGIPASTPISAAAVARVAEPRYVYTAPTMTELDNEAGDYNRVYVYCFDPEKVVGSGQSAGQRDAARSEMTPIADNAGTVYKYEMPRCEAGEMLSFKLLNVRLVRDQPRRWDNPRETRFEYHTDTVVEAGVDQHYLGGWDVLETVICNNLRECRPMSQGGIIPEGRDRTPQKAKTTCSPGKYIYYGWEDRPPGMSGPSADWTDIAWTDRDYDDIRIVIACPSLEAVEDRAVRLVK